MQNSCETEITYQKKLNFSIVNFTAIFRNLTFPANDFDQFDALVSTLGQKREVTLLALKEVQGKVHTWMNGNFKLFQFSINHSPCQSQKAFHSFCINLWESFMPNVCFSKESTKEPFNQQTCHELIFTLTTPTHPNKYPIALLFSFD